MSTIPNVRWIPELQEECTVLWHQTAEEQPLEEVGPGSLRRLVERQHRANFDLWHEEDKARDPLATDGAIAEVKRAIDRLNQRRNDLVEQIDVMILSEMQTVFDTHAEAPLHSETPGLMIDRLSILALKVFHTCEESERLSAPETHREKNRIRLALLIEQREDLSAALDSLFAEMRGGRRRFKLYRQMKMYNDPELNPAIYRHATGRKEEKNL